MEQDIHDFHIYASNLLKTAETRVLKDGDMFGVFNVAGDIETYGTGVKGLYLDDTRHLHHHDLRLYGQRPILLSSTVKRDNLLLTADLTNPDFEHGGLKIPDDMLHIFRSKFLYDNACFERLEIQNFGWKGSYPIELTLQFDADFRDMFEIRGHERRGHGEHHRTKIDGDEMSFAYTGLDDRVRTTEIAFATPPDELEPGRAVYHLDLLSGESTIVEYTIACGSRPIDEGRSQIVAPLTFDEKFDEVRERRAQLQRNQCRIESSNEMLDAWLTRSRSDLFMLQADTDWGPYPHAGIPWFNTEFGRDGIWTAYEVLTVSPELARGVLGYLAAHQATEVDAVKDAEPGKILHETRQSEAAAVGDVPFSKYYGSVDATPLFVWLAGEYLRRTDNRAFVESIWPSIRAAIDWIEEYGDEDGDGFVEYHRRSPTGLAQQGWKDSHDSVFHRDTSSATGPIALCEVQAYVYGARRAAADIAERLGHEQFAAEQREKAQTLRAKFERDFWSDRLGMYSLALDGDKQPCEVRASNAGHCLLFEDFISPERAGRLVEQLTSEAFFNQWGIRTLADGEARYNPLSYHNGSIWPHDNALIARGMANYGFHAETEQLFESLFEASQYFDLHRLPELFCGIPKRLGEGPTRYPVACSPQAWAAGAVYLLLAAMLDVRIDARRSAIEFDQPTLPEQIEGLRITDLPVGGHSVDLVLRRYSNDVGIEILERQGPVNVRILK